MSDIMLPPPVLNKQDMYKRIDRGEFGNTNVQWFNTAKWLTRDVLLAHPLWGIRHTKVSGFAGMRLNVPTGEVLPHIGAAFNNTDYQISPMIPVGILWEGNVYDHPTVGLMVDGTPRAKAGTWREHMQRPQHWRGSAAVEMLKTTLNANSYDDLMILRDYYPEHVYEMTVLDVTYGTLPGRNAVIWEVRKY